MTEIRHRHRFEEQYFAMKVRKKHYSKINETHACIGHTTRKTLVIPKVTLENL